MHQNQCIRSTGILFTDRQTNTHTYINHLRFRWGLITLNITETWFAKKDNAAGNFLISLFSIKKIHFVKSKGCPSFRMPWCMRHLFEYNRTNGNTNITICLKELTRHGHFYFRANECSRALPMLQGVWSPEMLQITWSLSIELPSFFRPRYQFTNCSRI